MLIVFLFFVLNKATAQNEFAATAFYTEFKKIAEDAQTGFQNCKGIKRKSEFEELTSEYLVKCMLPLADSGKLVIPFSGDPYAIYYFEPEKMRLKVDQRGLNLRDAIVTAFGKPLYTRTETTIVKNQPFTTSLYFIDPEESRSAKAIFRQCIYYSDGKFNLSFEIRGKKDPATN